MECCHPSPFFTLSCFELTKLTTIYYGDIRAGFLDLSTKHLKGKILDKRKDKRGRILLKLSVESCKLSLCSCILFFKVILAVFMGSYVYTF